MTQNLDTFFGLQAATSSEIDVARYVSILKALPGCPTSIPDDVHIHLIRFRIRSVHFGTEGLDARLDNLKISVKVNKKQEDNRSIILCNKIIGNPINSVHHQFSEFRNDYTVKSEHLVGNELFDEYVVTKVGDNVRLDDRKLSIVMIGHPLPSYRKFRNARPIKTATSFHLTESTRVLL